MRLSRVLDRLILALASFIGIVAFLYPFFISTLPQSPVQNAAHAQDAPFMTIVIVVFCLGAILATQSSGEMNSKTVAVLGILTAVNAVIRAVPGPAGFSLVFVLPILCGYVYGATFGFLLGTLSILASALIGGGVGPWLPYQMLATGWVGLSSSWLPDMRRWSKVEALILGLWGVIWGFVFGLIMNIWFWPYVYQPQQAQIYWQPGMSLGQTLRHYALFYMLTSFWWDMGRAVANALLTWLFGPAILKLLRRFQARFHFAMLPSP